MLEQNLSLKRGQVPGLIIFLGTTIWKLISWWANVDFVFSLKDGTFSDSLQLLVTQGWWLVAALSVVWIIWGFKMKPRQRTIRLETMIASIFVSFLFGVLLTTYQTDSSPAVFKLWTVNEAGCLTMVDSSRLVNFSKEDEMVLICGVDDPSVDKNRDTVIAKSSRFDIMGDTDVKMFAPFAGPILTHLHNGIGITVWHVLALVPKKIKDDKISCLDDVRKVGGRLLVKPTV